MSMKHRAPPRSPAGWRFALVASSLAAAASLGWSAAPQEQPRPEEVAARVNGEVILWKDVDSHFKNLKPLDVTDDLRKSVLRKQAEHILVRQFAVRKKLTVSDEEVDEAVQRVLKNYATAEEHAKMVRTNHGTMSEYLKTEREFLLLVKAYRYIILSQHTDPELKDLRLASDDVSVDQLRRFFDANPGKFEAIERVSFMRMGLQVSNPLDEEVKQAVIESVRRRWEIGADFSMLVFFHSNIRRALDFRDLGVSRADLHGIYSEETIRYLFDVLKEGEVSPVMKDGKSLNLFKMEQKVNQKAESFEQAQGKIRNMLEYQIREENRRRIVQWFRRQAKIEPVDLFEEK